MGLSEKSATFRAHAPRLIDDGVNTYSYNSLNAVTGRSPKDGSSGYSFNQGWGMRAGNYFGLMIVGGLQPYGFNYDPLDRLSAVGYDTYGLSNYWWLGGGYARQRIRMYDGDDLVFGEQSYGTFVRYVHGQGVDQPLAMARDTRSALTPNKHGI